MIWLNGASALMPHRGRNLARFQRAGQAGGVDLLEDVLDLPRGQRYPLRFPGDQQQVLFLQLEVEQLE